MEQHERYALAGFSSVVHWSESYGGSGHSPIPFAERCRALPEGFHSQSLDSIGSRMANRRKPKDNRAALILDGRFVAGAV
jgi:hypothetical protein